MLSTLPLTATIGLGVLIVSWGMQLFVSQARRRWWRWHRRRSSRSTGAVALARASSPAKRPPSRSSRRRRPLLFGPARIHLRWASAGAGVVKALALVLLAAATALLPRPASELPARLDESCETIFVAFGGLAGNATGAIKTDAMKAARRAVGLVFTSFPTEETEAETLKSAAACWVRSLGWSGAVTAVSLSCISAAGLCLLFISLACILVLFSRSTHSFLVRGVSKRKAFQERRRRCAIAVRDSNGVGEGGEGGPQGACEGCEAESVHNDEGGEESGPSVFSSRRYESGVRSVPSPMVIELTRKTTRLRANSKAFSVGVEEYK